MSRFQKYFQSWASKRSPRASQVVLRHKTIYVFPGRQGIGFLFVAFLIWLLGTNYQNNLILGFSFFLISVLLISIIHAFKNLLGLTFSPGAVQYSQVGDVAAFDIIIGSHYRAHHHSLLFSVANEDIISAEVEPGCVSKIRLGIIARQRGWLKLPRVSLKSYFPFGLIRAWAYIDLEHRALIFPRPIASQKPPLGIGQGDYLGQISNQRGEEFEGFQSYQAGVPLSQISWKHYARGAGLHLKDFRAHQSQKFWLDWQQLNARDTETGLSNMSYWVNEFSNNNIEFGLLLPGNTIAMGNGEIHRINALTALALFGWVEE